MNNQLSGGSELLDTLYGVLHPEAQETYDNLLNGIACHYERLGKGIKTAHAADKYTIEYVHGQLQSLIQAEISRAIHQFADGLVEKKVPVMTRSMLTPEYMDAVPVSTIQAAAKAVQEGGR